MQILLYLVARSVFLLRTRKKSFCACAVSARLVFRRRGSTDRRSAGRMDWIDQLFRKGEGELLVRLVPPRRKVGSRIPCLFAL